MALTDRMIRAVRGEENLFEEVEHDPSATTEAMTIVALVAVAGGISLALTQVLRGQIGGAAAGLVFGVITALVGWALFAGVTYFIGTRLFNAEATWEEVLRTLGYAESPMVVQIVSFVPLLGGLVALAAALWTLYLVFIAIRSALDITSGQTIITILLSLIPTAILTALILLPFRGLA